MKPTITRSLRIPPEIDEEVNEHQPNLSLTDAYLFFIHLGLKLYTHKTAFERNPKLIEEIVNKQKENLYKMKVSIQTEQFFKDMNNYQLDSNKHLMEMEQDQRKRKEEERMRRNYW